MAAKRRVVGTLVVGARILGWALITIAVLGLPQMRFLMPGLASLFRWLSSLALILAGVAWLAAVELFIRFFDQYLSRN